MLLLVLATVPALLVLSSAWRLVHNYGEAKRSGLRPVLCPINPDNPLWMILGAALATWMEAWFPAVIFEFIRRGTFGWEYREAAAGRPFTPPGFVLVNPGVNEYWIEDPELAHAVLSRWRDFQQGEITKSLLDFFGNNLLCSNGEDWQRQRRLVAPLVNESTSNHVWKEASRQAEEMIEYYLQSGDTQNCLEGLHLIAFNILSVVGYSASRPWKQRVQPPEPGFRLSYSDTVHEIVMNLAPAALVPTRLLVQPFMPEHVRNIGYAVQEFPRYTQRMVEKERERSQPSQAGENFLRAMVRVSDRERESDSKSGAKGSLSDSEIHGNSFLLTLAGYDTTANTLAYAVMWLVIKPHLQDWLAEEISQAAAESRANDDDSYESVFPKLPRCLALMFEVLRHHPPVGHLIRCTKSDQQITTERNTYRFPANSKVHVSVQALHMDPAIWGPDFREFRPDRWLQAAADAADPPTLKKMPRGAFLPWSLGARNCPGTRMAQVEFTRVMYDIVQRCRIEPVLASGETLWSAQERLRAEIKDSQPRISVQMNHPERVRLRWVAKS